MIVQKDAKLNRAKCLFVSLWVCEFVSEIQGYWAAYAAKNLSNTELSSLRKDGFGDIFCSFLLEAHWIKPEFYLIKKGEWNSERHFQIFSLSLKDKIFKIAFAI